MSKFVTMELTNAVIKRVKSLDRAKCRREERLWKAEGTKCVLDTVGAFRLYCLVATPAWLAEHQLPASVDRGAVVSAPASVVARLSSLSTPSEVVAVMHLPEPAPLDLKEEAARNLVLALDTIQDPGNMGTIIRTADWFGVRHLVCSAATTDCFAPKVVQSTMGALTRVRVSYVDDLAATLAGAAAAGVAVYGTFLDGEDINTVPLPASGIVVIGNEGRGISAEVARAVTRRLYIPPYPADAHTSESLNAAIATAITLSAFRRG